MSFEKYCHGSNSTGWMEQNETDTPRTDAVFSEPCAIHQVMQKWEKIIENSRQLERELNEANAEVERLKANLRRAILIVEGVLDYHPSVEELFCPEEVEELDAIKATLNQDNK